MDEEHEDAAGRKMKELKVTSTSIEAFGTSDGCQEKRIATVLKGLRHSALLVPVHLPSSGTLAHPYEQHLILLDISSDVGSLQFVNLHLQRKCVMHLCCSTVPVNLCWCSEF